MNVDELRPKLELILAARPVRLAYLFGSHAAGRARADSDIDVAVLLDGSLSAEERFEERMHLIGELQTLFRTDDVDIVILNEAAPLLAFEVLRNGKLLYCVDPNDRVEFQVRTVREYEDTAPLRKLLAEKLEQRIRAGTFGKPIGIR